MYTVCVIRVRKPLRMWSLWVHHTLGGRSRLLRVAPKELGSSPPCRNRSTTSPVISSNALDRCHSYAMYVRLPTTYIRRVCAISYLGKPLRVISVGGPSKKGCCALNLGFELPLRWDLVIRRLEVLFSTRRRAAPRACATEAEIGMDRVRQGRRAGGSASEVGWRKKKYIYCTKKVNTLHTQLQYRTQVILINHSVTVMFKTQTTGWSCDKCSMAVYADHGGFWLRQYFFCFCIPSQTNHHEARVTCMSCRQHAVGISSNTHAAVTVLRVRTSQESLSFPPFSNDPAVSPLRVQPHELRTTPKTLKLELHHTIGFRTPVSQAPSI